MSVAPSLSNQLIDDVLTKYFKDEKGWTVISLTIKGPSDKVVIVPASSTIKNISEMLVDILYRKEGSNDSERQKKKETLEELIKRLMQKSSNN